MPRQQLIASDDRKTSLLSECTPYHRCGSCWPDNCFAIQNYTRYYVKDFGVVAGREKMMAEIHNRGPIACSIGATPKFDLNYTGGIYTEYSDIPVCFAQSSCQYRTVFRAITLCQLVDGALTRRQTLSTGSYATPGAKPGYVRSSFNLSYLALLRARKVGSER